jgi:hypothetical protein
MYALEQPPNAFPSVYTPDALKDAFISWYQIVIELSVVALLRYRMYFAAGSLAIQGDVGLIPCNLRGRKIQHILGGSVGWRRRTLPKT